MLSYTYSRCIHKTRDIHLTSRHPSLNVISTCANNVVKTLNPCKENQICVPFSNQSPLIAEYILIEGRHAQFVVPYKVQLPLCGHPSKIICIVPNI